MKVELLGRVWEIFLKEAAFMERRNFLHSLTYSLFMSRMDEMAVATAVIQSHEATMKEAMH